MCYLCRPEDLTKKTPEARLKAMIPKATLKEMTPKVRLKEMTPKARLKAMTKTPEMAPEHKLPYEPSFGDSLTDIIYHPKASLAHSESVKLLFHKF